MSSSDGNKAVSAKTLTSAQENIKLNRYDIYSNVSGSSELENDNLITPLRSLRPNLFENLPVYREKHEIAVTLHIKETQTGTDCGSSNSVLTATQRPKSAFSDPGSSCSLFGVSLSQPLKYSRNALAVKDFVGKRRSSCSSLSLKNTKSGKGKK